MSFQCVYFPKFSKVENIKDQLDIYLSLNKKKVYYLNSLGKFSDLITETLFILSKGSSSTGTE